MGWMKINGVSVRVKGVRLIRISVYDGDLCYYATQRDTGLDETI